ncbi:uncharacterized protein LOC130782751 isoform X1 [Actinidia eriantha]|uniref:uncharacterized protein LOC130782751 isoform X1 n=1 Tax=Actinidia eriantha TaxID=165200 RepID=UPI0025853A1B|nr:uncharacterized protein LOC130782751 isoform X1 [Actinidia eriantha]
MSKFFGGKDPFDDPFFTHPFGGMFHTQSDSLNRSKEITIEELDSDGKLMNHSELSKEVVSKNPSGKNANGTKSFSYQRVAYGGLNGMYYSASVTRKSGNGGVVMMEINEEDKTVGQAQNTVSRGIQDKGHSVSTKRTSDGKVDTLHTLHNLNEDELAGFEETWKANEQILPSDWNSSFNLLENAGFFIQLMQTAATGGGIGGQLGVVGLFHRQSTQQMPEQICHSLKLGLLPGEEPKKPFLST